MKISKYEVIKLTGKCNLFLLKVTQLINLNNIKNFGNSLGVHKTTALCKHNPVGMSQLSIEAYPNT